MTNATLRKIVRNAQQEYTEAKIAHDATMHLVNAIKAEELRANAYFDEDTHERILDPAHDFSMSDADFLNYLQVLYRRYLAAGFAVETYEFAPQHRAERALREAERAVIDAVFVTAPRHVRAQLEPLRKYQHRADVRKQMIDLFMQLDPSTIQHGD